jgi:cytoskeleton protein RodZ
MSEDWGQDGTQAFAGQPAANDTLTAGALLRRARETAGLHVAALAVSLKVPVRKLEALEEDRWDDLPDAVFVRALASSVCRTLKIDPQSVLERLPQSAAPRLIRSDEGINTTFRAPSDGAAPGWVDQLSRPVFLIVFALLLGALLLVLLPSIQQDTSVASVISTRLAISAPESITPAAIAVEPANSAVSSAQPALMPAAAASSTDAKTAVVPSAAAAPAPMPSVPAASGVAAAPPGTGPVVSAAARSSPSPAVAAEPASATGPASAPASGIVVFRTRSPSWVEVTDAKGVVAVRRLMAAGEAAGASGALPLQVTIGRVDATEVQVRGKPFDLRAVSRDNVARFEVQ